MLFASTARRRPVGLLNFESLESRALLSAAKCAVLEPPVAADVESTSRQAVPRVDVANNYTLHSETLGNGSLVVTQEGNNIHGVFTAAKCQTATFDATFKKATSKVAKGTLDVLFIGEEQLKEANFKIKFKPASNGYTYTYNKLKFHPAPL